MHDVETDKRGFAALTEERRKEIASRGGKAAHEQGKAHTYTPDEARVSGRKGGQKVAINRKHMSEIGKKGGATVSQDRKHMAEIGAKGGRAVSHDREHMAKIGRTGGRNRGKTNGHEHVEEQTDGS